MPRPSSVALRGAPARGRRAVVSGLIAGVIGCGDTVVTSPPGEPVADCVAPSFVAADGRCVEPTSGPLDCPAGEAAFEGRCVPAGVPPEACGPYFEPDDARGCRPILPDAPCPAGEMALPGETRCGPVMECGEAPWGGIEVADDTVYVLASYPGQDSDGTAERPFVSIAAALDVITAGGVIAIGPGRYPTEQLQVDVPGVQLRGLCPQRVEIVAAVRLQAEGTGLDGVAVTGSEGSATVGVGAFGDGIRVSRVWIHDTTGIGALSEALEQDGRASEVSWSRILIEKAVGGGMLSGQQGLTAVADSEIRRTRESDVGLRHGISGGGATGRVSLRRVRIEEVGGAGLFFDGDHLTAEDLVVRNVAAKPDGAQSCIKIRQASTGNGQPVPLTTSELERVVVSDCEAEGIDVIGGDHTMRYVTLRRVGTGEGQIPSDGIVAGWDFEDPARLDLSFSTIVESERADVRVMASEVRLLGVYGGATTPLEGTFLTAGLVSHSVDEVRSVVDVEGCHFEGGFGGGLKLFGTDADVRGTIVEGSQPGPQLDNRASYGGFGIFVGPWADEEPAGPFSLTGAIVRGSAGAGVVGVDAQLTLRDVWVTGVEPWPDGTIGDGLWLLGGTADLSRVLIDDVARAGIAVTDGDLRWGNTRVCARPPLSLNDASEEVSSPNVCGCDEPAATKCAPTAPPLVSPSLDDEIY